MGDEVDVMTAAEIRVVTEFLGLSQRDLAAVLGVGERWVRKWFRGERAVPDGARREIEAIEAATGRAVGELVSALRDASDVGVVVYRRDDEMWAARPEWEPYPASWWRMVAARAAQEVPGVEFAYPEDLPGA